MSMEHKELMEYLIRIDERSVKIMTDVAGVKQHLKTLNGRTKKNEQDIEEVENKLGKLTAKVAVVATLLSAAGTGIWKWIIG